MSLVCHRITSTYSPKEDGGTVVDEDGDTWEKEFHGAARHLPSKPAPKFIPAALTYDEFGMPQKGEVVRTVSAPKFKAQDVASWYRGITARRDSDSGLIPVPSITHSTTGTATNYSANASTPSLVTAASRTSESNRKFGKSDWFSLRSLSEPVTDVNSTRTPSTLADLLSRNPPPSPSEPAFIPPVFLALGPSNKGFTMLQKKGWREGESLGRIPRIDLGKTKLQERPRPEVIDLTQSDVESEEGFIIDLVGSASEAEGEANELLLDSTPESEADSISMEAAVGAYEFPAHGGTALVTPLGTVLKADRLGIGLKARRMKKAITHSRAEIAAFVRTKRQLEKKKRGRGSKGMARKNREEELKRVQMLKYLNE